MDNTDRSELNELLEQPTESTWSKDYWNSLFKPLRQKLKAILRRRYRYLDSADLDDRVDEIICRLYEHFDFERLAEVPVHQRRVRFFAFVRRTILSVMAELYEQKGLRSSVQIEHQSTGSTRPPLRAREIIITAFQELSPGDQQIIQYRYFDKLTFREVAAQYAATNGEVITVNALKVRAVRAIGRLRQVIVRLSEPGGPDLS